MRLGLGVARRFFGGASLDWFPWHRVRVDAVSALRTDGVGRLAPNRANKFLAALKGLLRGSWQPPSTRKACRRTCSGEPWRSLMRREQVPFEGTQRA